MEEEYVSNKNVELLTQLFSGIVSGITSTSVTYPFNNIRLRSIEKYSYINYLFI